MVQFHLEELVWPASPSLCHGCNGRLATALCDAATVPKASASFAELVVVTIFVRVIMRAGSPLISLSPFTHSPRTLPVRGWFR